MSNVFWLTEVQMARFRLSFPNAMAALALMTDVF